MIAVIEPLGDHRNEATDNDVVVVKNTKKHLGPNLIIW